MSALLKTFDGADAVVRHCVTVHPDKYVSLLWPLLNANGQLIKYKPRLFYIKGCHIEGDTDNIRIIYNKLHIPTRTVEQSPVHKFARVNTPTKDVHKKLFVNTDETEGLDNKDKNEILDKLEYIDEGIGPVSLFFRIWTSTKPQPIPDIIWPSHWLHLVNINVYAKFHHNILHSSTEFDTRQSLDRW